MNIFYLDHDPKECAMAHVDKHVVKMIVEYAQLMSTAHRLLDGQEQGVLNTKGNLRKTWVLNGEPNWVLYKATHVNHPSAIWTRQSRDNYIWLYVMWVALLHEYTFRYGKVHKSAQLAPHLMYYPSNIPDTGFTEPTLAMPEQYHTSSAIESYRAYYNGDKAHLFSWKQRPIPHWVTSPIQLLT